MYDERNPKNQSLTEYSVWIQIFAGAVLNIYIYDLNVIPRTKVWHIDRILSLNSNFRRRYAPAYKQSLAQGPKSLIATTHALNRVAQKALINCA